MITPLTIVRRSQSGLGLFALEDIAKDTVVIEYTGEKISEEESQKRANRYLFEINDKWTLDGSDRKYTARYINHACRPNCEAELDEEDERIFIRAVKNIKAGDEITYNYGPDHFKEFIKPKGCKCKTCAKKKVTS